MTSCQLVFLVISNCCTTELLLQMRGMIYLESHVLRAPEELVVAVVGRQDPNQLALWVVPSDPHPACIITENLELSDGLLLAT